MNLREALKPENLAKERSRENGRIAVDRGYSLAARMSWTHSTLDEYFIVAGLIAKEIRKDLDSVENMNGNTTSSDCAEVPRSS